MPTEARSTIRPNRRRTSAVVVFAAAVAARDPDRTAVRVGGDDRVQAIELALPGDLVLVAGKGHEKYQVIGDKVLPFDDVSVAREALGRRRTNSGVV